MHFCRHAINYSKKQTVAQYSFNSTNLRLEDPHKKFVRRDVKEKSSGHLILNKITVTRDEHHALWRWPWNSASGADAAAQRDNRRRRTV